MLKREEKEGGGEKECRHDEPSQSTSKEWLAPFMTSIDALPVRKKGKEKRKRGKKKEHRARWIPFL